MPHLVANLIYLSQNYSYYIRGDRSPLKATKLVYYCLSHVGVKAHLHIEQETRNRASLRETCGEIPTTHKARNRAGYENQP